MLEERELRMMREEVERAAKKQKVERLERSWDLLNLCREVMNKEGLTWKASKERRDLEKKMNMERAEKIEKANKKSETAKYDYKCKTIQSKITTELSKLPENRRKLVETTEKREKSDTK